MGCAGCDQPPFAHAANRAALAAHAWTSIVHSCRLRGRGNGLSPFKLLGTWPEKHLHRLATRRARPRRPPMAMRGVSMQVGHANASGFGAASPVGAASSSCCSSGTSSCYGQGQQPAGCAGSQTARRGRLWQARIPGPVPEAAAPAARGSVAARATFAAGAGSGDEMYDKSSQVGLHLARREPNMPSA